MNRRHFFKALLAVSTVAFILPKTAPGWSIPPLGSAIITMEPPLFDKWLGVGMNRYAETDAQFQRRWANAIVVINGDRVQ